jgi:thiol-disulfide isomerase/thioredoxin
MRWTVTRALALLLGVTLSTQALAQQEEAVLSGPAPGFSLKVLNPDVAGRNWLALGALAGDEPEDAGSKVVLLSFFASWCAPCKKELPLLVDLDTRYRSLGLRVVGVSIDKEEPGIAAARRLLSDHRVAYPVLSDRFNFVARRYLGEQAPLPSVFLIRRDGTILAIDRGYTKDASAFLRAQVDEALGLKRAAAGPTAPAAPSVHKP